MYNIDEEQFAENFYFLIYDLETSQLFKFGQITEASFLLTDQFFNPIGGIKNFFGSLASCEIIHPMSVATTGFDVTANPGLPEASLSKQIYDYLNGIKDKYGGSTLYLVAHNGSRFDLDYLRFNLLRNFHNPYFYGFFKNLDSIDFFKRLAIKGQFTPPQIERDGTLMGSFALSHLAKSKLDSSIIQSHHAADDVNLLAALLKQTISNMPEGFSLHDAITSNALPLDAPFEVLRFDNQSMLASRTVCGVLVKDKNSFLLINLEDYLILEDKRSAIFYRNLGKNLIDFELAIENQDKWNDLLTKAKAQFKGLTISNFFSPSLMDIENYVYRAGFNFLSKTDLSLMNSEEKELFRRRRMRDFNPETADQGSMASYQKFFDSYCARRYSQGFCVAHNDPEIKSPSYQEMQNQIPQILDSEECANPNALKNLDYYLKDNAVRSSLIKQKML